LTATSSIKTKLRIDV
ncbi:unnamed protein product, partial [Rotaria magnacalcarata]